LLAGTARGGKLGGPIKRNAHADQDVEEDDPRIIDEDDPFNFTNDLHIEDDDAEWLISAHQLSATGQLTGSTGRC